MEQMLRNLLILILIGGLAILIGVIVRDLLDTVLDAIDPITR